MSEGLEFTGERFTPECVREIWYEHVHRYAFARELVKGKTVLDAACGEGYGSALLAATASHVTGLDIDPAAIDHARGRYRAENLEFTVGSCTGLPFEGERFDCVVSFETLEHLEQQDQMLAEFRRVLKPDGLLLISSPDKAVYTDKLGNRNAYHVRELYRDEFEALISTHFPASILWGQKLLFQSAIWALGGGAGLQCLQSRKDELTSTDLPRHDPVYFLALCASDRSHLPDRPLALSLFDDAAESVYEHYYHEIRKNMSAGKLLQEKELEIDDMKSRLEAAQRTLPWWRRLIGRR